MQAVLEELYQGKHLDQQQTTDTIKRIMRGELSEAEISALLIALKIKGENPDEIAGAAAALRESATPFARPPGLLVDTCGTGGDGLGTLNISTLVGLVVAECGIKVAKHGNRAVSSTCGSYDLLARFGARLDCSPAQSRRCLDELNFCFLSAPHYHPGVRFAMPVRQKLKTRTLFNLIGPLANPAAPDVQLMGVYDAGLLVPMARALGRLGCRKAFVVNGGGLDEIALHTETAVACLDNGEVTTFTFTPEQAGLARVPLHALQVRDAEACYVAALDALQGAGRIAHQHAVALNAAAVLLLCGHVEDLKAGAGMALAALASGRVAARLHAFVALSHA